MTEDVLLYSILLHTTRQENKKPLAHFICIASLSSEGMQNRAHRLLRATFPEGEKALFYRLCFLIMRWRQGIVAGSCRCEHTENDWVMCLSEYAPSRSRSSPWWWDNECDSNDRGRSRRIMERRGQKGWECGLRSEQLADRNASDFP
jgi:hypothetical protein